MSPLPGHDLLGDGRAKRRFLHWVNLRRQRIVQTSPGFSPTLQPLQTLTHAAVTRQKPPSAEGAGLIGAAVRRSVLEFELADSSRHQNQCRRRSTRRSPGCTLDAWFAWRDDRAEAMAKVHAYVERALARSRQRRRQHCVGRADVDGEAVRRGGGRGAAPNGRKARLHNRGVAKTQIMRDEACLVSDAAALTAAGLPAVGEARRRYTLRACLTPTGLKESLRLPRKRAFSRGPAPANAVRL